MKINTNAYNNVLYKDVNKKEPLSNLSHIGKHFYGGSRNHNILGEKNNKLIDQLVAKGFNQGEINGVDKLLNILSKSKLNYQECFLLIESVLLSGDFNKDYGGKRGDNKNNGDIGFSKDDNFIGVDDIVNLAKDIESAIHQCDVILKNKNKNKVLKAVETLKSQKIFAYELKEPSSQWLHIKEKLNLLVDGLPQTDHGIKYSRQARNILRSVQQRRKLEIEAVTLGEKPGVISLKSLDKILERLVYSLPDYVPKKYSMRKSELVSSLNENRRSLDDLLKQDQTENDSAVVKDPIYRKLLEDINANLLYAKKITVGSSFHDLLKSLSCIVDTACKNVALNEEKDHVKKAFYSFPGDTSTDVKEAWVSAGVGKKSVQAGVTVFAGRETLTTTDDERRIRQSKAGHLYGVNAKLDLGRTFKKVGANLTIGAGLGRKTGIFTEFQELDEFKIYKRNKPIINATKATYAKRYRLPQLVEGILSLKVSPDDRFFSIAGEVLKVRPEIYQAKNNAIAEVAAKAKGKVNSDIALEGAVGLRGEVAGTKAVKHKYSFPFDIVVQGDKEKKYIDGGAYKTRINEIVSLSDNCSCFVNRYLLDGQSSLKNAQPKDLLAALGRLNAFFDAYQAVLHRMKESEKENNFLLSDDLAKVKRSMEAELSENAQRFFGVDFRGGRVGAMSVMHLSLARILIELERQFSEQINDSSELKSYVNNIANQIGSKLKVFDFLNPNQVDTLKDKVAYPTAEYSSKKSKTKTFTATFTASVTPAATNVNKGIAIEHTSEKVMGPNRLRNGDYNIYRFIVPSGVDINTLQVPKLNNLLGQSSSSIWLNNLLAGSSLNLAGEASLVVEVVSFRPYWLKEITKNAKVTDENRDALNSKNPAKFSLAFAQVQGRVTASSTYSSPNLLPDPVFSLNVGGRNEKRRLQVLAELVFSDSLDHTAMVFYRMNFKNKNVQAWEEYSKDNRGSFLQLMKNSVSPGHYVQRQVNYFLNENIKRAQVVSEENAALAREFKSSFFQPIREYVNAGNNSDRLYQRSKSQFDKLYSLISKATDDQHAQVHQEKTLKSKSLTAMKDFSNTPEKIEKRLKKKGLAIKNTRIPSNPSILRRGSLCNFGQKDLPKKPSGKLERVAELSPPKTQQGRVVNVSERSLARLFQKETTVEKGKKPLLDEGGADDSDSVALAPASTSASVKAQAEVPNRAEQKPRKILLELLNEERLGENFRLSGLQHFSSNKATVSGAVNSPSPSVAATATPAENDVETKRRKLAKDATDYTADLLKDINAQKLLLTAKDLSKIKVYTQRINSLAENEEKFLKKKNNALGKRIKRLFFNDPKIQDPVDTYKTTLNKIVSNLPSNHLGQQYKQRAKTILTKSIP